MLLSPEEFSTQIKAYRHFVREVAIDMHKVISPTEKLSDEYLDRRISEIISFETKLANASSSDSDNVQVDELYNPFTVKYFQKYLDPYQPSRIPVKVCKNFISVMKCSGNFNHGNTLNYATARMEKLVGKSLQSCGNNIWSR